MAEKQEVGLPSVINRILELASSTDFSAGEIKDKPVADGEKVIGEMTAFEKACSAIVRSYEEQAQGASIGYWDTYTCLGRAKLANDLKWFSIRERLGETCPEQIGIRNGWQIVEIHNNEECDCPVCQLERAVFGGGMSIFGISIDRS